ncbi:MAG TPA: alpha/beta hydrolase [Planctomycetia bacterium]|nr:alpha/beta hydrolase [Planctomycetia bacterium]
MPIIAETEGCPLAADLVGAGPPVLFLQGVGVHGSGWTPQTEALKDRFACLSFDNRGIGRSMPQGAPITVERMAADALAVMDAAGWESAHVVGHSLGGLVALQLALAARSRVRSLALLCTFSGGSCAAPLSPRMIWWGMRSRLGTRRMRRHGFLGLVLAPGSGEDRDELAARLAALFGHDLADQPSITSHQLRALRRADLGDRLGELAALRTLIVAAAHDPIAPPASGRALAAGIPGAEYLEVADASHGLPITHAAWTNASLAKHWLAAESRQSAAC